MLGEAPGRPALGPSAEAMALLRFHPTTPGERTSTPQGQMHLTINTPITHVPGAHSTQPRSTSAQFAGPLWKASPAPQAQPQDDGDYGR